MSETVVIDGSLGEGGGQILRSALSLSMITGTPFRIENIRARRAKPGLLRQHLTAVDSAARICSADVHGNQLRSRELTFRPRSVKPGKYELNIGSAGSTTLVFETILPPLLLAPGPTEIIVEGGTHNPHAPPFEFLERAVLPILNRMGPRVEIEMERPGFYPRGGGRFRARITPSAHLEGAHLRRREPLVARRCRAAVAGLPRHIAEREVATIQSATGWPEECFEIHEWPAEYGPGNIVTIEIVGQETTEVFAGFGMRGVRAERVAARTLADAVRYLSVDVPVGECLADQLLLPLALAGSGSFRTLALSQHSRTNIDVIGRFLDVKISAIEEAPDAWLVSISGKP